MSVSITFLGGAGTVTGSKYLVRHAHYTVLVDCGLFQGYKPLRLRNWNPLPVAPDQVHAILLTHAHLDHSGYLPLMVREGFHGKVWATPGTGALCEILLPDSGHLQEEDAAYANRHGTSKHHPALPLYTQDDAKASLKRIHTVDFERSFEPFPGCRATYSHAGHILGAASLLLEVAGRRILFSGDLGRTDDFMLNPPAPAPQADTVLIESTYGNRLHPKEDVLAELAPALQRLAARGGVGVLPVFAVGRAQEILHAIQTLKARGDIPTRLPVFLDSPMAINTTQLYQRFASEHKLDREAVHALTHGATMVNTPDQSKALAQRHGPMVILAASGMATGGRVLHHLSLYAGNHRNMIILTGYQSPGTRGASLAQGASSVRIFGRDIAVNAEVVQLQSASAHADAQQLQDWLRTMPSAPDQVYIVHGEVEAADALRQRIERGLGWRTLIPEHGSTWPA